MKLIEKTITLSELRDMATKMFGNLVKAVVDVEKGIMVVDAQMHADIEFFLLENGSDQNNLWGINLYPAKIHSSDWIEFDSLINIRPSWGNKTRGIEDPKIQEKVRTIVKKLVVI
jgi:hypothetical protein